jgi:hypothetical protein
MSVCTQDAMQRTVIATWLVELYLGKLADATDAEQEDAYAAALRAFLTAQKDLLSKEGKETVYNLIATHGRVDEMLFFATLVGACAVPPPSLCLCRPWGGVVQASTAA